MANKLDNELVQLLARKISGLSRAEWKGTPRAQQVVYIQASRRALRAIDSYHEAKRRLDARRADARRKES